jgi:hypothetical protein
MSMQQIIEMLGKMAADRKDDKEDLTKMKEDREANQEELLARMDKMDAKMGKAAKQEDMLAELNAKMDANLTVIKSTINAFNKELEPNPEQNEAIVGSIRISTLMEQILRDQYDADISVMTALSEQVALAANKRRLTDRRESLGTVCRARFQNSRARPRNGYFSAMARPSSHYSTR